MAKKYGEFPIVLETYRECLRDVLDVPGLVELLTALHRRELSLVEVETPTASPFASSLLFDYVATYMYEGDTPNAERRAAALSLDRDLLRELLGQEELRDLIDPGALAQVEDDLQHLSDRTPRGQPGRAARRAAPRRRSDRAPRRAPACSTGSTRRGCSRTCAPSAGPCASGSAGEERWIDAADAGLYRDALGVVAARRPAGRVPRGRARTRWSGWCAATPPPTGRSPRTRSARATASTAQPRWASSSARASSSAASCDPAAASASGATPRCCAGCAARRWPCCARRSSRPTSVALARFLPAWQGVDRHPASGAGIDRLREVLVPLQGLALPAEVWERDVLPRRVGAYSPTWMDQLCASGEVVWIGAGALGRSSGRVALYFREDLPMLGAAVLQGRHRLDSEAHDLVRARLAAGACFFTDLLVDVALAPEELQEALWDLVWAGEATNDAFAPLRAPRLTLARAQRERQRSGRAGRFARAGAGRRRRPGAGPVVADGDAVSRQAAMPPRAAARSPSCCSSATGS